MLIEGESKVSLNERKFSEPLVIRYCGYVEVIQCSGVGLYIESCQEVVIRQSKGGIRIIDTPSVMVEGCQLIGVEIGLYVESCKVVQIRNNVVYNCQIGIKIVNPVRGIRDQVIYIHGNLFSRRTDRLAQNQCDVWANNLIRPLHQLNNRKHGKPIVDQDFIQM